MKQQFVRALPIFLFLLFAMVFHNNVMAQADAQPKVTKTFETGMDGVNVDIIKGVVTYKLYVRSSARGAWKLDASATVKEPADPKSTSDIVLTRPDSYQIKLEITMDCDTCASVRFQ